MRRVKDAQTRFPLCSACQPRHSSGNGRVAVDNVKAALTHDVTQLAHRRQIAAGKGRADAVDAVNTASERKIFLRHIGDAGIGGNLDRMSVLNQLSDQTAEKDHRAADGGYI